MAWLATKRSPHTRAAYLRDMAQWASWLAGHGVTLLGADETAAAMWARYLGAAGTKNTTAARKLTVVSSFYGWCARRGHLTASPFVSLDRPVVDYDTSATPGLTGDQATALLEAADTDRGPQAARTAALKVGRRWTAEEESVARSAFAGAFGKAPAFGGGFDEPASLARERRAFENAAIEAVLDYRNVVCGMDTAAGDHTAGKITVEEFIERSVHAHTDSISARVDSDIARNAKTLKISAITAVVLLVIWWIIILTAGFSILVGGVVSLAILGGCIFVYFTFNPYDHR